MKTAATRRRRASAAPFKPSKDELRAAAGKSVPDVIAPALRVLFVGINPGLYTAAIGHHFGRPGNRFWPALRDAGFTARLLTPFEEYELLTLGLGVTNVVNRATASAAELDDAELRAGARRLEAKVARYRPRVVALLGVEVYRKAFARARAGLGLQAEQLAGARVWVLPNPSGLNAHYQRADFARLFRALKEFVDRGATG